MIFSNLNSILNLIFVNLLSELKKADFLLFTIYQLPYTIYQLPTSPICKCANNIKLTKITFKENNIKLGLIDNLRWLSMVLFSHTLDQQRGCLNNGSANPYPY